MLSRAMRVPSAATHVQESPCFPPVDWMTKWRAFAGGSASSAAGTCAKADATAAASHTDTSIRCIQYSVNSTPRDRRAVQDRSTRPLTPDAGPLRDEGQETALRSACLRDA